MKNAKNPTITRNPAYHETKRHSDTMFAFNVYPCTIPADFNFVPLHWQDSVEIIYIKRGTGIVQVDFETYRAEAGDIFLVMPGHLHGIRSILQNRMEYENIIFDMNFLGSDNVDLCSQKYLQPILNEKIKLPPHIGKDNALYPSISACLDASDHLCSLHREGYELGVKGHFLILFSLLMQLSKKSDGQNGHMIHQNTEKLKTILSHIEENYNKKITVAAAAAECGYSESHFMRWFKEMTGTGFAAYLIDYRLSRAAQALHNSDASILEIAVQNGFDNLSNFNRLFKKRFEMTPNQFRRTLDGQN